MISVDSWLTYLQSSHAAAGVPLVVCGLALMLYGWRLWKLCVVLSYAAIGGAIGAWYTGPGEQQWLYALTGALLLGFVSYWPVSAALSVLGGLLGGGALAYVLYRAGLTGVSFWSLSALAFAVFCAYGFLNRQRIVILFTAFLGAALLISGLAAWIMALPGLYGTFRYLAQYSIIVVPFLLLVPTVMSYFYQIAEMRRLNMSV